MHAPCAEPPNPRQHRYGTACPVYPERSGSALQDAEWGPSGSQRGSRGEPSRREGTRTGESPLSWARGLQTARSLQPTEQIATVGQICNLPTVGVGFHPDPPVPLGARSPLGSDLSPILSPVASAKEEASRDGGSLLSDIALLALFILSDAPRSRREPGRRGDVGLVPRRS